jgi:hypothetical protein
VTVEADATSGHVRVYGIAPSVGIVGVDTWERDLRAALGDIPGVASIEIVAERAPPGLTD